MSRRHSSINQKLTRIILFVCGISILMACAALAFYDAYAFRKELASALDSTAGIAGSNSTAALAFSDAQAARDVLNSLRAQPHIVEACIYTRDGSVFATYARDRSDSRFTPPVRKSQGLEFNPREMILFQSIQLRGEEVGTIYLKSDLNELWMRTLRFAEIVVLAILASFVTAYLLASRLQRLISGPILALATTASTISLGKNYSLRAIKSGDDKVGSLVDRFNEMLSRIQEREAALQQAHDSLELRVDDRTLELQREIAERKQTERALENRTSFLNSLIAHSPLAIVALGPDQEVQLCNPAFEVLFGYHLANILGRPLSDLLGAPEIQSEMESSSKRLSEGKTTHLVTRRKRSDGTLVDVDGFSVPILAEGKVTGAVVLYQDITQRKRAEEALLKAKEEAESASRAKSEFLANMSHEIRTPMNGIIGMTDLALDTELNDEQREYLGMVKISANSLLVVINDILDFSKIEAGKLEIEMIDFPFKQSLGETLKLLGQRAHLKRLELAWRVAPGVPEWLKGDVGRLRQILVNLVGNAMKFTDRGEIVVDVEKKEQDADGVMLHFRVRDTGIGIPQEKLGLIFDAFTQADSSATRKYGGTGLGLAITSQLVELIGGKVWVESEVGHGSTFHFTARFGFAAEHGSAPQTADPEIAQGLHVLVVDDNYTNRVILVEMLSAWGMLPEPVEEGGAALISLERAYQQRAPFRLMITDMQMPDMDGCALSEQVRQNLNFGDIPILLLSSSARLGEATRCRQLAIARYLTKPVQPSELLDVILGTLSNAAETAAPAPLKLAAPGEEKNYPLRVLLAEDNAVNRRLVTAILEKRGHTVVAAENGREALDFLEWKSIDVVLMDVQMPVMDGFQAIGIIRRNEQSSGAHLPIIALTAHAMKGDRERCLAAGADEYVAKPIRPNELLAAIGRALTYWTGSSALPPPPSGTGGSSALDVATALERVEGDRDLLEELARLFAAEYQINILEIRQAFDARDFHRLEMVAHTVKGASANLGASGVMEAARALEDLAHGGNLDKAPRLIELLDMEFARLLPELGSLYRKVAP
jgi:PAS domain S-box-containing protein